jgi:hypothetical protein
MHSKIKESTNDLKFGKKIPFPEPEDKLKDLL